MTQDNAENEAKAREMLAAELEYGGLAGHAALVRRGTVNSQWDAAIRALTKALQPSPLSGDEVEIVARALEQSASVCSSALGRLSAQFTNYDWQSLARAALASLQDRRPEDKTDLSERSASAPEGLTE